jgi:hypothetical protein
MAKGESQKSISENDKDKSIADAPQPNLDRFWLGFDSGDQEVFEYDG